MPRFIVGHATHPEWTGAFALVAAQLDAQMAAPGANGILGAAAADLPSAGRVGRAAPAAPAADPAQAAHPSPTLGLVYITDAYAAAAEPLLAALRQRWPGVAFVGTVGVGVCAGGVEYFDEPALVVMLTALPREQFQVFSGTAGLRAAVGTRSAPRRAATALVHVDPATPELPELLGELAARTESGYLFGGVSASRQRHVQIAEGVFQGGLSGVAFGAGVSVISRVTQGCTPLGPARRVTACDGSVVLALDGLPALPQLLGDLHLVRRGGGGSGSGGDTLHPRALREAVPRLRRTLVGLTEPAAGPRRAEGALALASALAKGRGNFGEEVRVRHLIGIDPARQGFAVAETVHPGMGLSFCERDAAAARRDLVRMCTEVRDELETRAEALHPPVRTAAAGSTADRGAGQAAAGGVAPGPADGPGAALGAIYISCSGRGGAHFGGPSAELQLVRHALGDVPLVGFFAAGEIAGRQLYGYTGVLTVFCAE